MTTLKENIFTITDDGKLKTSEIFALLKKKMNVWSYWSDKELDKYFLPPKKSTTRQFPKTQEPDHLGKSADEIDSDRTKGCTIREYALMQMQYFEETGEHLDVKNITLCTASRLPDGRVAFGRWGPDFRKVDFGWLSPGDSTADLGARLEISSSTLKPCSLPDTLEINGNLYRKIT